jgi:hypothetical protein
VILLGGLLAITVLVSPAAAVPPDDDVALIQEHLQALVEPVLRVAQDERVRWLVRGEAMRQVYGDTSVLLSTFISEAEQARIFSRNDPDWQRLKQEVAGFRGINGNAYDAQIYIPYLDAILIPGALTVAVASADGSGIPAGHQLDGYREVITLDVPIDECYMRTHEVWILSIHEPAGDSLEIRAVRADPAGVTGKSGARVMGPMIKCDSVKLDSPSRLAYPPPATLGAVVADQ